MNMTKMLDEAVSGKPVEDVQTWIAELDDALKREKDWRKTARNCVSLYECGKATDNQFNILFSNTETLAPALYNNTPRPVVDRRFKDADPIGKMVSRIGQRTLEFLIDPSISEYTPFDGLMTQAVLEALVPGRGVTRFKYDAVFEEVPADEATGEAAGERVTYETVCGEVIPWDRFRHGYAKQWVDVPWISIEHFMSREECEENFPEIGASIPLTVDGNPANDSSEDSDNEKLQDAEGVKLAHIFEIWDKRTKRVLFLCPAHKSGFIKEVDDPLRLSGFFPIPKPLMLFDKISSLVPVTLYTTYEGQARELNRITVRINKIIEALKVRGFYDSTLEGLDRLMSAEDNTLLPAENVAAMQQGQTLEKAIWLMPIEKLVTVLQQLYIQRQQIKSVIYEITGISDILRGSSVASETATAQNIKNQWGTLRLKRLQKLVMRYARDSLRIMAEIALTKLSQETLAGMTGLKFPGEADKAQAQAVMQQAQAMKQPPPAGIEAVLTLPTWTELKAIMDDDLQRNYKIDIETNSTVDAEATEDKANMGEFLNALAQFLNGVAPMVQEGIMPFDAAKAIMLAVTRRYRFGPEVEDELAKMQPPKPVGGDAAGEAEKAAAEQEAQANGARLKLEAEVAQAEAKARMATLALEQQMAQAEAEAKMQELRLKAELGVMQHRAALGQLRLKAETAQANADAAREKAKSPGINKE